MTPSTLPEAARFRDLLLQVQARGWEWRSMRLDDSGFTWRFTSGGRTYWITADTGAAGLRTFLTRLEQERSHAPALRRHFSHLRTRVLRHARW